MCLLIMSYANARHNITAVQPAFVRGIDRVAIAPITSQQTVIYDSTDDGDVFVPGHMYTIVYGLEIRDPNAVNLQIEVTCLVSQPPNPTPQIAVLSTQCFPLQAFLDGYSASFVYPDNATGTCSVTLDISITAVSGQIVLTNFRIVDNGLLKF